MAKREPAADELALPVPKDDAVAAFERLVKDPAVDVAKLEHLMRLHGRVLDQQAETAWNAAMSDAQAAMRPVATDASNPSTRSRYASYAAIDGALRPIYARHGFALSFDTDTAGTPDAVRVLCRVSHRAGHSRTYHVDMPADGMGAKGGAVMTKTHAVGSAMSYGMRYLVKMIFNVSIGDDDDDGNAAGGRLLPAALPAAVKPDGFDAWWADMQAVADNGIGELQKAWAQSKPELKSYLVASDRRAWEEVKTKAAKVVPT